MVTGLVPNIRAFVWAVYRLRWVHRELPGGGMETRVPAAPRPHGRGTRGVYAAILLLHPTCLERALVMQAWVAGHRPAPDVVIGVRNGVSGVEAHAWLAAGDRWFDPSYTELTRLAR